MSLRLVDPRRDPGFWRRHGAIAALTAAALAAVVALSALGSAARLAADNRATTQALGAAAALARTIVDRDRIVLDRLVSDTASGDSTVSAPPAGIRGAALFDPAGTPTAGAGEGIDAAALAALGAAAAHAVAEQPDAELLAIPAAPSGDGDPGFAALARPWSGAGGLTGGIAVVAIGREAFAALDRLPVLPKGSRLDILTADGVPLFGPAAAPDTAARSEAVADAPLVLRYRPAVNHAARMLRAALPFVLIALAGLAAAAGLGFVLVRRDRAAHREIARRAAVERKLREELGATAAAADRTDEIARAKSRFYAQVTHELRTPLNAILGFSETIRQEMFGPVANPRYLQYAGLIHDAGAHLLSLINDLLDNARIEAGRLEIAPIRVSAAALARSALDLVELLAAERGIALAASGFGDCPDLNIDPRAMKQVLVNLLSNAIKYTPARGKIDVRFTGRSDGGVTIEVADTGAGMSAEDVLYAFEPFGRSGANRSRRQPGTGLGLSLARALVRLHGGDLTLASRLDAGTTATVTLPASAAFGASGPRLVSTTKRDAAAA